MMTAFTSLHMQVVVNVALIYITIYQQIIYDFYFFFFFFRLEAYDRNSNFGTTSSENVTPEWCMLLPDPALYKDLTLNSPVPVMTRNVVETYLQRYGSKLGWNCQDLYEER